MLQSGYSSPRPRGSGYEGIADLDFPIPAPVLEVLREDFRQAVTLSMSPHVGVKPRQLVGCRPTQSCSYGGFVWIENGKLGQQFFRFPPGLVRKKEGGAASYRARDHCNKFNDGLVGKP